ncbi:MAG: type II secretion system protein GspG [Gemmatimonadales bacterium]|nr:type II secretion system protein GspG [Gemmatimonadales bacterium]
MFRSRSNHRSDSGFTLMEVVIAVALVAILAVSLGPLVMKNLQDGKVSRAQSDVQAIGNAIETFYKDTGSWPNTQNDGTGTVDYLTSSPTILVAATGGITFTSQDDNTTLSNQLILNTPTYSTSTRPHLSAGWNGPYMGADSLDPWGMPYVVNMEYVGDATHTVLVVSAGPNKTYDSFGTTPETSTGTDDLCYVLQKNSQ